MDPVVLRVADYLGLVNSALAQMPVDVLIEGEVSDFRVSQQKWVTFVLKDEEQQAVLPCFMTTWQLHVPLEDGMRVRVVGAPKVTGRFGKFQLNVTDVQPVGEGALKRAYALLKKKLTDEGVFDFSRKRMIPRFPERIGLITSRDAAAYGDFLRILNNRWGGVEIRFAHVHVQGREAVPEILGAFAAFNRLPEAERPDMLALVRGGGGLEDLHAFNDEQVVRAVFQSKVPVIVGVGHERDESLCDFAADIRASTPSNAAERAVPNRTEVSYEIEAMVRHVDNRLSDTLAGLKQRLESGVNAMGFALENRRESVVRAARELVARAETWLPSVTTRVEAVRRVLASVDPARVLARGYALVRVKNRVVSDASMLDLGAEVDVQLAHGSFGARVTGLGKRPKGQQSLV